jgi:hypothetical protein
MVRATAKGPVKPGVAGGPIVQGNLGKRATRAGNFRNSTKTPGNFGRLAAMLAAQNNGQ